MTLTRRHLLKSSAAAALGAVALPGLVARAANPSPRGQSGKVDGGYGELVVAGAELALPVGFRYAVLNRQGVPMSDGKPTPGAFDGMAAFTVGGKTRLIRNHEIRTPRPTLVWRLSWRSAILREPMIRCPVAAPRRSNWPSPPMGRRV